MGRELKRVRLDFNWPIGKIWHGYINPFYKHAKRCLACEGRGDSPEGRLLENMWYGYVHFDPKSKGSEPFTKDHPKIRAFAERQIQNSPHYYGTGESSIQKEAQRLTDLYNNQWRHHLSQEDVDILFNSEGGLPNLVHEWVIGKGWTKKDGITEPPTAKEVNDYYLMSHDGPQLYQLYSYILRKNKQKERCSVCKGQSLLWSDPRQQFLSRRWKKFDPPKGDGFQLWGTTNEGEPLSPVFKTLDALSEWCAKNATTFATNKTSKENWKQMLSDNLVVHQEGDMVFI